MAAPVACCVDTPTPATIQPVLSRHERKFNGHGLWCELPAKIESIIALNAVHSRGDHHEKLFIHIHPCYAWVRHFGQRTKLASSRRLKRRTGHRQELH